MFFFINSKPKSEAILEELTETQQLDPVEFTSMG